MTITKNDIKIIKSLKSKKGRDLYHRFLAEGVRLLEEALNRKVHPEIVYFAADSLSERGERLLARFHSKNIPVERLPAKILESISDTRTSQGIIGLFPIPKTTSLESLCKNNRTILWCENISDPGNLGTLLRSAMAFKVGGIILSGTSADIFNPKVVRSSAGAVFCLSFYQASTMEIIAGIKNRNGYLMAADIRGENWYKNLPSLKKIPSLIIAVGSEADGLSADIINKADSITALPISDRTESLNVAVAGSIMMNDLYQRNLNKK